MRKRSPQEEALLLYRSKKEMERRRKKNRKFLNIQYIHTPLPSTYNTGWHILRSPSYLNFENKYDVTSNFIEKIRRFVLRKNLSVFVDMNSCLDIEPDVALVLAAEIQRARALYPDSINGRNPRRRRPMRLLRCLGFHELLGFEHRPLISDQQNESVEYIQMRSGASGQTNSFPEIINKVIGGPATLSGKPAYNSISRALSEALHNAVQHAYEDITAIQYPIADDFRWWLAGYRDPNNREIAFIFYDQGMTIPESLPKKWGEAARAAAQTVIRTLGLSQSSSIDGTMLAAAMEIGRTSTKQKGRGWGLSEMRALVGGPSAQNNSVQGITGSGKGSLRILSRDGAYLYNHDTGEKLHALSTTFYGTLIVWRLIDSDIVIWRENDDENTH